MRWGPLIAVVVAVPLAACGVDTGDPESVAQGYLDSLVSEDCAHLDLSLRSLVEESERTSCEDDAERFFQGLYDNDMQCPVASYEIGEMTERPDSASFEITLEGPTTDAPECRAETTNTVLNLLKTDDGWVVTGLSTARRAEGDI